MADNWPIPIVEWLSVHLSSSQQLNNIFQHSVLTLTVSFANVIFTCKQRLMVLCWQVHVVVSQRLRPSCLCVSLVLSTAEQTQRILPHFAIYSTHQISAVSHNRWPPASMPIHGENGQTINECIFSLQFLCSLHSRTQFFFYKFKIFIHSIDFVCGDWWLYFPKDLVFPQNHCQARQSSVFWDRDETAFWGIKVSK